MHDLPPPPSYFSLEKRPSPLASIFKIPPGGGQTEVAYKDLACSEQDKQIIFEIITTMAEFGKLSLLMKQSHLKELGGKIRHVHPLKFLATIFSHPRLKSCMWDIFDDYFKRNGFMNGSGPLDGLGPSLTREAEKGKLNQYLQDFAAEVKASPQHVQRYFQSHEWEDLVRFLMQS